MLEQIVAYGLTLAGTVGGTDQTIADARFVKVSVTDGTADGEFLQATAGDSVIGVSQVPQATRFAVVQGAGEVLPPTIPTVTMSTGERIDIFTDKAPRVELGGTVNAGNWVASDANGMAVAAAPAAGVNINVAGIALGSGVAGGFIPVLLKQSIIQG